MTASSSPSAGATRLASPIRSASSAPISLPVITSSFARPSPTICGSRDEPPTSGISPIRVSGMPTIASAASTRKSHASASSSAPPMHAPWIAQITGLGISSATFQACEHVAPERAQAFRRRAQGAERGEVHAGGEERPGAAYHHDPHGRVVGRRAQRGAGGQHQLGVERVALLRPVEDDVADGAVIF